MANSVVGYNWNVSALAGPLPNFVANSCTSSLSATSGNLYSFILAAAATVSLPDATAQANIGNVIAVALNTAGGYSLTINPFGAQKIAGASSLTLNASGEMACMVSDGANYQLLSNTAVSVSAGADVTVALVGDAATLSVGAATTPVLTPHAGAGAGATSTAAGNDFAGVLTLTTGAGSTDASSQCTFAQSASFGSGPVAVSLTPANANAAALAGTNFPIATVTSTGFIITSQGGSLTAAAYAFNYFLHQ